MKKLILFAIVIAALRWWFTDPSVSVTNDNPSNEDINFGYIVEYSGGASSGDTLPMLVALHGNGDTADYFYESALTELKEPSRIVLIKAPIPYGSGASWPARGRGFAHFGKPLKDVIELLSIKFSTKGKPVLMGFSGGGMMAFYQALKYGDSYSTIISVSGMMSKNLLGEGELHTGAKVSAFHGKSDRVVSFSGSQWAVELLKEENVDVEFTPFEGGHLGIFREMKSKISKEIDYAILSLD